jgi:hypothetical protein
MVSQRRTRSQQITVFLTIYHPSWWMISGIGGGSLVPPSSFRVCVSDCTTLLPRHLASTNKHTNRERERERERERDGDVHTERPSSERDKVLRRREQSVVAHWWRRRRENGVENGVIWVLVDQVWWWLMWSCVVVGRERLQQQQQLLHGLV